jgi:hypothetical protein
MIPGPLSGLNPAPGHAAQTWTDGTHTITNPSVIHTPGSTITGQSGANMTLTAGGGGGGGSVTAGLGVYTAGASPTTIGNTGTIIQSGATGTEAAKGVTLNGGASVDGSPGSLRFNAGDVTTTGTTTYRNKHGGVAYSTGGDVNFGAGGYGTGGTFGGNAGHASNGVDIANGGRILAGGGYVSSSPGFSYGGVMQVQGGYAGGGTVAGGVVNIFGGDGSGTLVGGGVTIRSGISSGAGQAGTVLIDPGSNGVNPGGVVIAHLPASDPHVLGQMWASTATGIATISQG